MTQHQLHHDERTNALHRAPVAAPASTIAPASEDSFDFWRGVHRSLRGRYRTAFLLAIAGTAVGGYVGSFMGQRIFSATGLVRIASVLPQVLRETDQNKPLPMFDGFIEAQRELMMSRETIRAAMEEETWRRAVGGQRVITEEQFAAGLKVETRSRSDHLRVSFKHADASLTSAAVKSVISAYQQAFTREQDRVETQRLEQLRGRRNGLAEQLSDIEDRMSKVAGGRTAAELEPAYLAAVDRVKKLRIALADVQYSIAGGPELSAEPLVRARTPSEVADEEFLRAYSTQKARIELQLIDARSRGLGPAHEVVVRLTAQAEECREQAAQYARACEARRNGTEPDKARPNLAEREANLRSLIQAGDDGVAELAGQRVKMKGLEDQASALRQSLGETDSRLDALATEATQGGRLSIITSGDKPTSALLDNRAKTAAFGAAAGLVLPLGALVAGGSIRRRFRFCDEVAASLLDRVPFVAVLPDVGGAGPLDAAAARSIHELRVRLQPRDATEHRAYLVSSITEGEGKTSVAISLGLSFAAAGFRTLLIDADPAGRCVSLGFNAGDAPGLIEAAAGDEPSLHELRCGLSVLSAGRCGPGDTFRLSPPATARLLAEVREQFDVVLIDSDPLLTGLSASVIAPLVDGVVLTLARGQEQALAKSAMRQLELLGAVPAGAVFNRACAADFRVVMQGQGETQAAAHAASARALPERLRRFGPIVAATLNSLSLTREDDLSLGLEPDEQLESEEMRKAA